MAAGDLDPKDWIAFKEKAHRLLDESLTNMQNAGEGRVWTPIPDELRHSFKRAVPRKGSDAEEILKEILPYGVGNTHPRFFGWVHGAGAPNGVLADVIAASMNVNAGGRDHIGPVVEREVINWCAEVFGFKGDTSGLIVSGTSLATIIALKVARDQAAQNARKVGIQQGQMVGYTSSQTHTCVKRAFDMLGIGSDQLRMVSCNDAFEMDISELRKAIVADLDKGLQPFCVVGTAGAVNMGAIDDFRSINEIAKEFGLWFHIDGAFGATAAIGELAKDQLAGLNLADSLAFDFHKWFQVNYEAGLVLFKDKASHRASFTDRAEYLRAMSRGLGGGAFWAVDYGPELSRGFRALKVWTHLLEHGFDALGHTVDRNILLARYLAARIEKEPNLQSMAPVPLNINCFRFVKEGVDLDKFNEEIVISLQEQGIAVPSTTVLHGEVAIRVNITNHRTQEKDLDILVDAILDIGSKLSA